MNAVYARTQMAAILFAREEFALPMIPCLSPFSGAVFKPRMFRNEQHCGVFADSLLGGIAEQLFCSAVPGQDGAVEIKGHDAHVCLLEDAALIFGQFSLLLLGATKLRLETFGLAYIYNKFSDCANATVLRNDGGSSQPVPGVGLSAVGVHFDAVNPTISEGFQGRAFGTGLVSRGMREEFVAVRRGCEVDRITLAPEPAIDKGNAHLPVDDDQAASYVVEDSERVAKTDG